MTKHLCDVDDMQGRSERVRVPGLRRIRENSNMRQEDLAELIGLSVSMISQLETGSKGASHKTLLRLSKALHCSIEQLSMTDREYPKPLSAFLDTLAPDDITDEEVDALLAIRIPGRQLTPRAYSDLLNAIRNAEKMSS